MPLEKIVRPYTQAEISPPKTTTTPRATNNPARVTLQIGLRGSVKILKTTYNSQASAYDIKTPTEKSL